MNAVGPARRGRHRRTYLSLAPSPGNQGPGMNAERPLASGAGSCPLTGTVLRIRGQGQPDTVAGEPRPRGREIERLRLPAPIAPDYPASIPDTDDRSAETLVHFYAAVDTLATVARSQRPIQQLLRH